MESPSSAIGRDACSSSRRGSRGIVIGAPSRPRLRTALVLAGTLVAAAVAAWLLVLREPPRPDIVLVVWDTCRVDRLAAFGYRRPTTPWLQRFAAEAARYPHCYAPAPWTAPSHASLFTGLMPSRHGLRTGRGDSVRREIPLLAETLARAGYDTIGVSANPYVSGITGLSRGFQAFRPLLNGKNGDRVVREVEGTLVERATAGGERRPLFLFVNFMDSHLPYNAPRETVRLLGDTGDGPGAVERARGVTQGDALCHLLGARRLDDETVRALSGLYDAGIRELDGHTAALMELLASRGLLENAVVAVTADHGENLGEHGCLDHRLSVLESLLHVPLAVRWPGRLPVGETVEAPVSLMDLYPTLLEAAGAAVPAGTGLDARPLGAAGAEARALLAEHGPMLVYAPELRRQFPFAPEGSLEPLRYLFQAARHTAVGEGRWKYVRVLRLGDSNRYEPVSEALYDLQVDPGEDRDLLLATAPAGGAASAAAARLRALLSAPDAPLGR